jgi:uncharacterized membrane protein YfcA
MSLGKGSSAAIATATATGVVVVNARAGDIARELVLLVPGAVAGKVMGLYLGQDLGNVVPWGPYWLHIDLLAEREI